MNGTDNVNETKEYQDQLEAHMLLLFIKYKKVYCINVQNGCMSRVNHQEMKELEENARNKKQMH